MDGLDLLGAHRHSDSSLTGEPPPAGQLLFFVLLGLGFMVGGSLLVAKMWEAR